MNGFIVAGLIWRGLKVLSIVTSRALSASDYSDAGPCLSPSCWHWVVNEPSHVFKSGLNLISMFGSANRPAQWKSSNVFKLNGVPSKAFHQYVLNCISRRFPPTAHTQTQHACTHIEMLVHKTRKEWSKTCFHSNSKVLPEIQMISKESFLSALFWCFTTMPWCSMSSTIDYAPFFCISVWAFLFLCFYHR